MIKYDYAGENTLGLIPDEEIVPNTYYKGALNTLPYYYWSGSSSNRNSTWSNSSFNVEVLNGSFLENLTNKWSDLIATTNWQVGGNTTSNIYNTSVQNTYKNELINPVDNITFNAKIGLMYVSDYGYAVNPENWDKKLSEYDEDFNRNNNWLYMGGYEWFITPRNERAGFAFSINSAGRVNFSYVNYNYGVRPCFYLRDNIKYISGTGTSSDPFIITV